MDLGTVLALFGVLLAVVSCFVPQYPHRLLAVGVILIGIAVLIGADPITTKSALGL